MNLYYILEGKVPRKAKTFDEFVKCMEDLQTRRVALTKIGEITISTIFLGIDYDLFREIPLLFETMVFGGALNGERERYTTYNEAMAGHQAMVERVKATFDVLPIVFGDMIE